MSLMHQPKLGDRYQWRHGNVREVYEVTGEMMDGHYPCIDIDSGYRCQYVFNSSFHWTYLGNFSKQDNFTQLYELFSQDI